MAEIDSILEKYPFIQPDNLIPILQEIQDNLGFLSKEALVKVGKHLQMPTSKIYGLATFYNQFRFEARGKYHIRICNGTSCHIKMNTLIIKELIKKIGIKNGEVTKNGLFSFQETDCLSGCGNGPVLAVNDTFYINMTVEKLHEIINYYQQIEHQ